MEERVTQLENELRELKAMYMKDNFEAKQVFRKDIDFVGRVGFFTKTGVTQAAAIAAPPNPSGAYNQSEAQQTVDAVNFIRTVLKNLGLTA
jgi:hypothetical protein